jgi:elongation factor Ts
MTIMAISAKAVSELRARTGAGMMDCKKALEEAGGDMDKAGEILRRKGIAKAEKRTDRSASQGLIVLEAAPDRQSAAMIELNCETDFVARTEEFIGLARDLATHVAKQGPQGVHPGADFEGQPFRGQTVGEVVKAMSGKTGEAMALKRAARFTAAGGVIGSYLHFNGQTGVLVELQGPRGKAAESLAKEIALHIASADPIGVSEADIPAAHIERERRIAEEQVAAEGKPDNIRAKIVDGKIKKFVAERTLLGQPFVKDDSKTVGQLVQEASKAAGASLTVVRFARFKVGES